MKESEWKRFKRLKDICLDRYCNSVLEEATEICSQEAKSNHDRYIELYQLMRKRDKELGKAFDGLSRNQSHIQLMMMYRMNVCWFGVYGSKQTEKLYANQGIYSG